jgi:hypothetical protein
MLRRPKSFVVVLTSFAQIAASEGVSCGAGVGGSCGPASIGAFQSRKAASTQL